MFLTNVDGDRIRAVPYRRGYQAADTRVLPNGAEVRLPSRREMKDARRGGPDLALDDYVTPAFVEHFTGWFVVPGLGLCAVFVATRPNAATSFA